MQRFWRALNAHVHLHLCVLDGVVAKGRPGLVFRGTQEYEACAERVPAAVRQWEVGLFEQRGILTKETVAEKIRDWVRVAITSACGRAGRSAGSS